METNSAESPHAGHNHDGGCTHAGGVPTLIRAASQDFRGFLGDLERATKPYRDLKREHHVTTGDELLPWYRLMTLSDPHNLRGYMIGSMLLTYAKKPDEALAFIQEGIEKNRGNPQAYRLYVSLAQVHWKSGRLEKSLAAARTGFELAKAVRPHGGEIGAARKGVLWTEDLENDFLFVARFVPLFLNRKGDLAQALRVAREIASLAPEDVPTAQLIAKLENELSEQGRTPD
jgi:tetratricopeptide (TPR) repeat protein